MKYIALISFSVLIYLVFFQQDEIEILEQIRPQKSIIKNKSLSKDSVPERIKERPNIRSLQVLKKETHSSSISSTTTTHDPNVLPEDENGNLYIQNVLLDQGYMISHGDIILGPDIDISKYQDTNESLKLKKPKTWPKGVIPYLVESLLPNQGRIQSALKVFMQSSKIRFIKRTNEANYVVFKKGEVNCYSSLGMIGGKQFIHLADNCEQKEINHELMHTLGFLHEQNRIDRDEYVDVLWENIKKEHHLQFKKISNNFIDLSEFEFDYDSIMLYGSSFFSISSEDYSIIKINGDPIENQSNELSQQDWVKINHLYP